MRNACTSHTPYGTYIYIAENYWRWYRMSTPTQKKRNTHRTPNKHRGLDITSAGSRVRSVRLELLNTIIHSIHLNYSYEWIKAILWINKTSDDILGIPFVCWRTASANVKPIHIFIYIGEHEGWQRDMAMGTGVCDAIVTVSTDTHTHPNTVSLWRKQRYSHMAHRFDTYIVHSYRSCNNIL